MNKKKAACKPTWSTEQHVDIQRTQNGWMVTAKVWIPSRRGKEPWKNWQHYRWCFTADDLAGVAAFVTTYFASTSSLKDLARAGERQ